MHVHSVLFARTYVHGPVVQFALGKTGPALRKVGRVFLAAIACSSVAKTDEDEALEHLHLVDEVSIYLTESRYIDYLDEC